jgi:hypothetical protein
MKFAEFKIKTRKNNSNGQSSLSLPKKLLKSIPEFVIVKIPNKYLKKKIIKW